MPTVLVFLHDPGAVLAKNDRELLTLAGTLGDPVAAVAGDAGDPLLDGLGSYGVSTCYLPADPSVGKSLVAGKAAFLAEAVRASGASVVLLGNAYEAKEIAARAGVRLESGVITDVVAVADDLTATKSVFAGSYTSQCRVTTGIPILAVKPNSIEAADAGQPATPETVRVEVPAPAAAAVITGRVDKPATGRPDLAEARVIVAGGRGVDGNFAPLEELADLLGGAVGASRAATDAGWIEHSAQIGQTGKTVSPQLYISAGISGAVQQKAGMQTSQVIVAINKDPDSPVFEIADFGVVGDLFTVLPQAAEEIRKRRA
ncbi:electron transfer flavoprotein subunit alpha/FixB family protein [Arthrobacter sp. MSA 4-2]|uniref:electron transfer flavoprotein subunit alpha/FixB family protein n=1 Tax=Arthrobacter sp. MSA 4-2 TaxID=2794349 RepID=UPI0018E8FDF2|nr:electron transfer flavoprotein subunit alpha/FixB family protein [Arthrobacter sp. MSA 4-2]MBJ2121017.1 electron transfer flavoprotein subunit alpha/FixB family protein [Arthrobacter sp. MSA 4-2]